MTGGRAAELADRLRERIALGEFAGTGAIESEASLGGRYGVSRVTVRRALESLREQGLVEPRKGAGWFVVGAFHQTLALGSFRHAPSAVGELGRRVERVVVDFGFRAAPAHLLDGVLRLAPDDEVLYSRSVRSVDGEPLDLVHEWVPAAVAADISRADAQAPGIWQSLQRAGHPVDAVRQTITAAVATPADSALLGVPAGAPLLLVRRVASDATGTPIALSDHRYLAHRFALEVEFRGGPVAATPEPPGLRTVPTSPTTEENP
ncbi:UTRA domain-containing protein [Modestobacter sp. I12A-02628]|uniref:GntR family transcriptional regulator n=1 Tax=Goekera deserti TaxID=2497753 RepID=A0A7K3WKV1_9ACTN|nr:GntR family transcriptional regulator [Goekera deserti]MPQ97108.1 UTRA domain-containing protein [Goekera deserti]NDI46574.1 UTRA domain-containing protein [Goekera deserti]NEL56330.1 GntR family transcriptional regulator [Goekera deserti]